MVRAATPDLVLLRCTCQELAQQQLFVDTELLHPIWPYLALMPGDYALWPYVPAPRASVIAPEHFHMPPGELAVSHGTRVQALDGPVGRVDEFTISPETGQITHLVLREGHLWGQKDVTIPVAQIDHIADDTVFLKLDKRGLEALPAVAVKHWMS